jgi:hypothetical protein
MKPNDVGINWRKKINQEKIKKYINSNKKWSN